MSMMERAPREERRKAVVSKAVFSPGLRDDATGLLSPPNSPSGKVKPVSCEKVEEEQSNPPPPISLSGSSTSLDQRKTDQPPKEGKILGLKARLRLNGTLCGAQTLKGAPCKRNMSARPASIDPRISELESLTQASPELRSRLNELAGFVQCYLHRHEKAKEQRVREWLSEFPLADVGGPIGSSVSNRILDLLSQFTTKCPYKKQGTRECGQRIGGQKVQNCERTIAEIVKTETYRADAQLERLLSVLEVNWRCRLHEAEALVKTAQWQSDINAIIQKYDPDAATASETNATSGGLEGKSDGDPPPCRQSPEGDGENDGGLLSPGDTGPAFDPITYWSPAFITTPFKTLETAGVCGPTKAYGSRKDGHLYAYTVDGNPGFVKIGYTTREITERLAEWEFNCNRRTENIFPGPSARGVRVPDPCHVEAQCHEELAGRRVWVDCAVCKTYHTEWFLVSSQEAIAVIRKHSDLAVKAPDVLFIDE